MTSWCTHHAFLFKLQRALWIVLGGLMVCGLLLAAIPNVSFPPHTSAVIFDRHNQLLGARVAADGQWRFPPGDNTPARFAESLLTFEDRRFYFHPGVDPVAVVRATITNLRAHRIVSGASTITMQVARLAQKRRGQSLWDKLLETAMAIKLELTHSKEQILNLYTSHAPFGGNVVGVEAAAWRYFGRGPESLSWAESATLAVLPNAPALIHPGRNRSALKNKRDRLLRTMHQRGTIDGATLRLSLLEPLPKKPHALPHHAPHLLTRALLEHGPARHRTTVDGTLQRRVEDAVSRHYQRIKGNGIHNVGVVILDIPAQQTLAYVGNTRHSPEQHNDVANAPRSTGSILKPLLFAAALDEGLMFPDELLTDIPTRFGGFAPENFGHEYDGAVPAAEALARSLNVPAVRLLDRYGVHRFQQDLIDAGLTTLHRTPEEYGLSLIVGGAEATLWELTAAYARLGMAVRQANTPGNADFEPTFVMDHPPTVKQHRVPAAPAIYETFQALLEVKRPGFSSVWHRLASSRMIAWKTGTSYGFRDAWAIGVTPDYAVGVWVGNASGEGRPHLTGLSAAAPLLFSVFGMLPQTQWFERPRHGWQQVTLCRHSGVLATPSCPKTTLSLVPTALAQGAACPHCTIIHCDEGCQHQVHAKCAPLASIHPTKRFVLPPDQEFYYRALHPEYRPAPPPREDCEDRHGLSNLSIVYPKKGSNVYVPVELNGAEGRVVFHAAHRRDRETLYWHLDDTFLGATTDFHRFASHPLPGEHVLTVVDSRGESVQRSFTVLAKGD